MAASFAEAINTFEDALKRRIHFVHRLQSSIVQVVQHPCGLFFLSMLFQFAFAFCSDRFQTLFGFSKCFQVMLTLLAQLLGECLDKIVFHTSPLGSRPLRGAKYMPVGLGSSGS